MAAQILVVDDDDDARGGLVDALSEEYPAIAEAENGQEALDLIHGGVRPALIVLDLRMPVMDGASFLRHRATDPSMDDAPVIVLTAETSIRPELAASVAAVLPKPVPLPRLLEIIHTLCDEPARPGERTGSRLRAAPADARPPGGVERRRHRLVA